MLATMIYESPTSAEVFMICYVVINGSHGSGRGLSRVKGLHISYSNTLCEAICSGGRMNWKTARVSGISLDISSV